MAGTLYVVATPLGNLGDLSPRAAETLRQVAVVAAEDTRHTRPLLAHVGARAKLVAWHAHSAERDRERLLRLLTTGHDVALVTDAGTPAVSDPGVALVAAARARDFPVVTIPGPTAVA
ncbi:MAG: SAM-dependent methyltransferase, partial [Gemmatimonadales bacterium]